MGSSMVTRTRDLRLMKWLRGIGIGLGVLLTTIALGLGMCALRPASTATIEGPNPISAIERVLIGGVEQTMLLRGQDRDNPVLFFVHGGPGMAHMPGAPVYSGELEEHFVVVHLDQRGAGSSCDGIVHSDLTIDRMVEDTIEASEMLAKRFGGNGRIFLLGHSWGTVLATLAAQRRPELFHAYIGVSQVVTGSLNEQLSYDYVVREAKRLHDEEALEALARFHPPYSDLDDLGTQRRLLSKFGGTVHNTEQIKTAILPLLFGPEWTLGTRLDFVDCFVASASSMWPSVMEDIDFASSVPRLEMPVYLFAGRHDWQTPHPLVEQWSKVLEAPQVKLVWFEDAAHTVPFESPVQFQRELIESVRPLAETPIPAPGPSS